MAVNSYLICGADGQWGSQIDCTGGDGYSSWEICREGGCVDSPYVNIGHDNVESWTTSVGLAANFWLIATINVPKNVDMKIFSLNAVLSDVPAGMSMRMAVWEDTVGSYGRQPGKLVAYTAL